MKKKIKNIIFYVLAILLSLYLIVDIMVPDKTVSIFGFKTFVIVSPSMEPKINVNDAVMVRKSKIENLDSGDIITFKAYIPELGQTAYVTHYLGDKTRTETGWILKTHGEGDLTFDQWTDADGNAVDVTEEDVIGVVAFTIPKAGHFFKIFQDPIMFLLITVNIGIVIYIVYYIKKTKKSESDKTVE